MKKVITQRNHRTTEDPILQKVKRVVTFPGKRSWVYVIISLLHLVWYEQYPENMDCQHGLAAKVTTT